MKTIKGFAFNTGRGYTYQRTPAARLAMFRQMHSGGDWRKPRAAMHAPDVSPLSPGFNSKDYGVRSDRYPVMTSYGGEQFRREQWADECGEVGRMEHSGWFSDADCSRTLRAFVFRLSHGRWGCGYADSDSGERVYLLEVHPDARSAAASADHEAQHYAEQEKEYSERCNEARKLRDERDEAQKRLRCYLASRNDQRTAGRELAAMELSNLRDIAKKLADYSDIEE
jgi:hypothetical protein